MIIIVQRLGYIHSSTHVKKKCIVKHVKNTTINIDDVFCVQLINFLFAISQQIVDTLSCQYLTSISFFFFFFFGIMAPQVAQTVKNLPTMQETRV